MSATRLQKLLDKRTQLDAQIRNLEARAKHQERRNDTRRKIIAGALALEHIRTNPSSEIAKRFQALLDEYVTRPYERELFGLAPLPDSTPPRRRPLKAEFKG
jgi:hypothetical protein